MRQTAPARHPSRQHSSPTPPQSPHSPSARQRSGARQALAPVSSGQQSSPLPPQLRHAPATQTTCIPADAQSRVLSQAKQSPLKQSPDRHSSGSEQAHPFCRAGLAHSSHRPSTQTCASVHAAHSDASTATSVAVSSATSSATSPRPASGARTRQRPFSQNWPSGQSVRVRHAEPTAGVLEQARSVRQSERRNTPLA